MHTCGRCKVEFVEEQMCVQKTGEFRNNWLCLDQEACGERCAAGGKGRRVRQASSRHLGES